MKNKIHSVVLACSFMTLNSYAGDISSDVRKGTNSPNINEASYVEIGVSIGVSSSPFYGMPDNNRSGDINAISSVDLNFHLQHKGFFVEAFNQSLATGTVGYNVYNNDTWALDLVAGMQYPEINSEDYNDLKGVKTRRALGMAGFRATGYYDDYIIQLHALLGGNKDYNGGDKNYEGSNLSLRVARHWQYKNWNFHSILGATFVSKGINDYYYSIQPEDATEKFHAFNAESGINGVVEIGATYPINQSWVFRGLLRHNEFDKNLKDSPLFVSTNSNLLLTSINYVF